MVDTARRKFRSFFTIVFSSVRFAVSHHCYCKLWFCGHSLAVRFTKWLTSTAVEKKCIICQLGIASWYTSLHFFVGQHFEWTHRRRKAMPATKPDRGRLGLLKVFAFAFAWTFSQLTKVCHVCWCFHMLLLMATVRLFMKNCLKMTFAQSGFWT